MPGALCSLGYGPQLPHGLVTQVDAPRALVTTFPSLIDPRLGSTPIAGGGAMAGALMLTSLLRGQSPADALASAAGASAALGMGMGSLSAGAAVGNADAAAAAAAAAPVVAAVAREAAALAAVLQPGRAAYLLTDVDALSVAAGSSSLGGVMGASSLGGSSSAGSSSSGEFLEEGGSEGLLPWW